MRVKRAIAEGLPVLLLLRSDFKATQGALRNLRQIACPSLFRSRRQACTRSRGSSPIRNAQRFFARSCRRPMASSPPRRRRLPFMAPGDSSRRHIRRRCALGFFATVRRAARDFHRHAGMECAVAPTSRRPPARARTGRAGHGVRRKSAALSQSSGRPWPAISLAPRDRATAALWGIPGRDARHKIVLQADKSAVPGQVAGDALLCRMPCVGGDGAIDRLAFRRFADTVVR